jgi:demethylmenaquinone methyltransferase / 2-methoxy-6-polyprenyl-1,4-benzoquinol methylase
MASYTLRVTLPQDCPPQAAVRPHRVLPRYYQSEELRRPFIKRVFDDAAGHYDRLENLMSLGVGRWYRRRALKRAGLRPGMKVLDVAIGTGLVAREALGIVGDAGCVIGVDPSAGMLSQAADALPLRLIRGRAEELPFAPDTFDFLSMGYALRHLSDLAESLRQFTRVLRPGGILLMLEITAPRKGLRRVLMGDYVRRLVPMVSRLLPARRAPANPEASRLLMDYYWDTVTECVEPRTVVSVMDRAGLSRSRWWAEFGVFSEYTAVKAGG